MIGNIVFAQDGEPRGREKISDTSTAIGFTNTFFMYDKSGGLAKIQIKAALISVEGAAIRFTIEGTTPTVTAGTAVGHTLYSGDNYMIRGWEACRNFKCINEVAGNGAKVECTYFY
jgi:hypothetical protein